MNKNYSDYIIYVDESGDHSLSSIDESYPMFVPPVGMIFSSKNTLIPIMQLKNSKSLSLSILGMIWLFYMKMRYEETRAILKC